jgi:hypothetical protein
MLRTLARLFAIAFALLGCTTPAAMGAKTPLPTGAVKLSKAKVKRVGVVRCGTIAGKRFPGTIVRSRYFITHAQQSKNFAKLARRSKGSKRRSYDRKAKAFAKKARRQLPTCRRKPATNVPPGWTPTPASTSTPTPLRFNVNGASGLALRSSSASFSLTAASRNAAAPTSNLSAVDATGGVRDAVSSGSASISKFLIAPNNRIYVLFARRSNLNDTTANNYGSGCLLAEVDPSTGIPTCVDQTLQNISWGLSGAKNPAIQFDNAGAIYYSGNTSDGKTVLRKYASGHVTDLISDNVYLQDFLVLPDANVFVTGGTTSTGVQWVRRITPGGGLQNLRSTQSQFLRLFPDGNVYMGMWGTNDFGVRRFLTGTNQVESKYWISAPINAETPEQYFNASDFCGEADWSVRQGFCGSYGAFIKASFETGDGNAYAIAGNGGEGVLAQYYPVLSFPTTAVRKISVAQGVITNLVLAGLNAQDQNVMTLYNTSTATESQLIGPDQEIEVYHLNYVASGNKIMFDGLRFADNKYVLGQVDLNTKQVTASNTSTVRWEDFQTFR